MTVRECDSHLSSWILAFNKAGRRPGLFCMCAGGGDALEYRELAEALPQDQPVYAFGMPEGEEIETVQQLAKIFIEKMYELQRHGPFQLCGFSFGGLIAYEIAAQLAARGEKVALLALIDTVHPKYYQNLSSWEKVKFNFTFLFNRLAKYGQNVVRLRIQRLARDASRFASRIRRTLLHKTSEDGFKNYVRRLSAKQAIIAAAWHNYVPVRYDGRLLLISALGRSPEYKADPTIGWRKCSNGEIVVKSVSGEHETIMHAPFVKTLADQLLLHLAAVTAPDKKAIRC